MHICMTSLKELFMKANSVLKSLYPGNDYLLYQDAINQSISNVHNIDGNIREVHEYFGKYDESTRILMQLG